MLMRGIFPMKHKRSSAIVGLGHDRRTSTLAVRWRSGNVSFHHRVPRELFAEFLGAESLGRFFRERVRGKFTKSLCEGRENRGAISAWGNSRPFLRSRGTEQVCPMPQIKSPVDCSLLAAEAKPEIHARLTK
jgi:hypothetical protein